MYESSEREYLKMNLDSKRGEAREWRGEQTQERDKRLSMERKAPNSSNKILCDKS